MGRRESGRHDACPCPSEWPATDARTTYQGEELFKEFCDAQSNTGPSKRALDIGYNVLFFLHKSHYQYNMKNLEIFHDYLEGGLAKYYWAFEEPGSLFTKLVGGRDLAPMIRTAKLGNFSCFRNLSLHAAVQRQLKGIMLCKRRYAFHFRPVKSSTPSLLL